VVGTERLFADGQSTFVQPLGLGVAASLHVERGQCIKALGDFGMVGAERLLLDLHRAQVKGRDFCEAILLAVAVGKVDRHRGDKKIIGATRLFDDCQSAFEKRLGLRVTVIPIASESLLS